MAEFFKHLFQKDSKPEFGSGSVVNQKYRLEAELGRGGMGIVYRAHDLINDREVALKVVNAERANALTLEQFEREAEITARLNHPHIVMAYETGTVDIGGSQPSPFIAMELVKGTSLDEMHGFTYARIVDIGKQICDALEYAHSQGVVYRDLKPANVILQKRGFGYFVKLLDFGLARPRGAAYRANESSLAGSYFYLAPELISGQVADVSSDLYALGATLYEMITGRVPFSDFDEESVLEQHLGEKAAPPSHSRHDVPPALDALVIRLLEKKPQDRYASALEVRRALDQIQLADSSAARGNLPSLDSTAREDDLARILPLLEAHLLVTLLNDDASLALTVAAHVKDQFTGGAWLVDLGSVSAPNWVLETIALALGVREDRRLGLAMSLIEYLREKNMLILLAHCERVLPACAQFAGTILQTCPDVRILATCHQPLNVADEVCYPADL